MQLCSTLSIVTVSFVNNLLEQNQIKTNTTPSSKGPLSPKISKKNISRFSVTKTIFYIVILLQIYDKYIKKRTKHFYVWIKKYIKALPANRVHYSVQS